MSELNGSAAQLNDLEMGAASQAYSLPSADFVRGDARLSALANSIAHIVWSCDRNGVFDYANERWTEYTRQQPAGVDAGAWLALVHSDDRDLVRRCFERSIATGERIDCEFRLLRWDGVYRWHLARGVAQRNADGEIIRWFGTSTDIDDFKTAETALRISDHDLQLQAHMLASVQQAIISTDRRGCITTWNQFAQSLYGWPAEETIGCDIRELLLNETELGDTSWADVLHSGARVDQERRVRRKDGALIWVSITASPITDEAGNISHIVSTSVDITERRRLEQQFRQAQKMEAVGRLAGGVAHDFNNLLTVIKGHTEFLSRELPDEGQSREDIEQISRAAQRAASLTRQLLAFSRQQVLEKRVLDPNSLLRDLEKMLARLIGEDIVLRVSLGADVPLILADPGQVEQAVMNLVVNARDAMPAGGDLRLSTSSVVISAEDAERHTEARPGRYSAISVGDTGSGIEPEMLVKIFEPFFTTKEAGRGTGLGLATVYGIVQQSGGFVDVVSTPHKGAVFTIYLPAAPADGNGASTGQPSYGAPGDELILLVEDQDDVRAVARRILLTRGYRVIEARNGVDALALLHGLEAGIDLVVTDAVMPQMGGVALIRALRTKQPDLPVVIVSGYTDRELVTHGAAELNVPFLHKPFQAEDLLRLVRKALDKVQ